MVSPLADWSVNSIVQVMANCVEVSVLAIALTEYQECHEPDEYGYQWQYRKSE